MVTIALIQSTIWYVRPFDAALLSAVVLRMTPAYQDLERGYRCCCLLATRCMFNDNPAPLVFVGARTLHLPAPGVLLAAELRREAPALRPSRPSLQPALSKLRGNVFGRPLGRWPPIDALTHVVNRQRHAMTNQFMKIIRA